jgi:Domain of unknown function (DUF4351)
MATKTKKTTTKGDQDSPWKKILRQYLREAIEFFFPAIDTIVDWSEPPVFLDKEFVQISQDAKIGKRYADQLVQLKRKNGPPFVLLLHIEIQASKEDNFEERMFIYALRIFDYFRQPAISVAILCDPNPAWRPTEYQFTLPETKLSFQFGTVKLLDYQTQRPQLATSHNPFAWVVLAHLTLQETKRDKPTRKIWKLHLTQQLHESGYNQQDVINIFHFLDWLLKLPKPLEKEFWQELRTYEEERKMPYITSVERIGREIGRKEGKAEERQSLVSLQLRQKVGPLPKPISDRITQLSPDQQQSLAIALLEFTTIDDLESWLADRD